MKNIIILVMIILFWFLLATILSFVAADNYLISVSMDQNTSLYDIGVNTTQYNVTEQLAQSTPTGWTVAKMIGGMFVSRIPNFHPAANFFIKFVNWLLILVGLIVSYRLISPATGE